MALRKSDCQTVMTSNWHNTVKNSLGLLFFSFGVEIFFSVVFSPVTAVHKSDFILLIMWTTEKWRQLSINTFSGRHYGFDGTCKISLQNRTTSEGPTQALNVKAAPIRVRQCVIKCTVHDVTNKNSSQSTITTCGSAIRHQPRISTLPSFSVHALFFETFIPLLRIPSPKQMPQRVRFNASALKFRYLLSFLKLFSNCLCLLLRLPVSSNFSYICPPIRCFRRQFLRNMWPIQLAFLLFILCKISLSSFTLCNTSSFLTRSVQMISMLLQHHTSKHSRYIRSIFRKIPLSAAWNLCCECSISLGSSLKLQTELFILGMLNFRL